MLKKVKKKCPKKRVFELFGELEQADDNILGFFLLEILKKIINTNNTKFYKNLTINKFFTSKTKCCFLVPDRLYSGTVSTCMYLYM